MNNIFSKLRDFVGFNDPYDYEDEEDGDAAYRNMYHQDHTQPLPEEESRQRRTRERINTDVGIGARMSNVIDMPGPSNSMYEVIVMEPRSFEEMPQAIQALRDRKSVVLNLTMMDPDQAQRAVDFVAGGTFATDGHQERVGESIFLFTPNCVQVTTQSGVVHEVAPPQMHTQRTTTPTPAWAPETTRIAKPS